MTNGSYFRSSPPVFLQWPINGETKCRISVGCTVRVHAYIKPERAAEMLFHDCSSALGTGSAYGHSNLTHSSFAVAGPALWTQHIKRASSSVCLASAITSMTDSNRGWKSA